MGEARPADSQGCAVTYDDYVSRTTGERTEPYLRKYLGPQKSIASAVHAAFGSICIALPFANNVAITYLARRAISQREQMRLLLASCAVCVCV